MKDRTTPLIRSGIVDKSHIVTYQLIQPHPFFFFSLRLMMRISGGKEK